MKKIKKVSLPKKTLVKKELNNNEMKSIKGGMKRFEELKT